MTGFTCFSCGKPMHSGYYIGWCGSCEVSEYVIPGYEAPPSQGSTWDGKYLEYIDHSREHSPHP